MSDTALAALFGLLAALCGGLGVFTGKQLTGRVGWLRTAWLAQAIGLPLVTGIASLLSGAPTGGSGLLYALGLGLLNVFSVVALYRAFAAGSLSIVAPISSSYAAITVAFAFLAGEPPSLPLAAGLATVLLGIAVVAAVRGVADDAGRSRAAGVVWAVLSSISLGAVFFWIEPVSAELGPVWTVALMRASGVAALAVLRVSLAPAGPRAPVPLALLAACVLLDTGGLLFYSVGVGLGGAALVAVLASLSSVIAVILAQRRLRERLSLGQWIGIVLVLAGTVGISVCLHLG